MFESEVYHKAADHNEDLLMKAQYLQKKCLVRGLKGMLERGPSA